MVRSPIAWRRFTIQKKGILLPLVCLSLCMGAVEIRFKEHFPLGSLTLAYRVWDLLALPNTELEVKVPLAFRPSQPR